MATTDQPPVAARPSAVPMFAAPEPMDPPPATTAAAATVSSPASATTSTSGSPVPAPRSSRLARLRLPGSQPATSDPDDAGEQLPGATSTDGRAGGLRWRRRYAPGGEPAEVQEFIAFLLVGLVGVVGLSLRRTARTVRQPTRREQAAIAEPLARIACRHLPMHMLGPDMLDIVKASGATSAYVNAGPLTVPRVTSGTIHSEEPL